MITRRLALGVASAALAPAVLGAAEPGVLRIVVAYPPGGVSDLMARLIADRLEAHLQRTVVVENQPGAAGTLALSRLAHRSVHARTLVLCATTPLALARRLGLRVPPVVPVCGVMHTPQLLLGTSLLGGKNFGEVIEYARQSPGAVRWATSGVGTLGHLVLGQVAKAFNVDVVHVPYKGGGEQLRDALGGQFELLSSNLAVMQISYVKAGRLSALALGAPARCAPLPDVPTFAELGCPAANLSSLFGLFAAPGTSRGEVRRLNAALNAALSSPDIRDAIQDSGNLPASGSVAEFEAQIARQSALLSRAADDVNLR
jgi:tripartite-type tricarboxylate transporter receptor subunit TctC